MPSPATPPASPLTPKTTITWPPKYTTHTLLTLFLLSTYTIYLSPPSLHTLFPAFTHVRQTGFYPDNLPVRRRYTGIYVLDEMATGLAGLFSAASDGRDSATWAFCVWFMPQLCGVLVFIYWEAGKVALGGGPSNRFTRVPTFFGVLAQLIAAGPTLPLYFIAHTHSIPLVPVPPALPARAQALLPAILIGFVLPSAALFLVPSASMSLDTKQIVAAIWQPFPLYIAVLFPVLTYVSCCLLNLSSPAMNGKEKEKDEREQAVRWINISYAISGALSAVAHWAIFFPTIIPLPSFINAHSDPALSFKHIFIPYILHPYLPASPLEPPKLAGYRLAARLLFQHDWLYMTLAALVFFAWHHIAILREYSDMGKGKVQVRGMGSWVAWVAVWTVVGGPGAAFSWAAVERERVVLGILSAREEKEEEKGHGQKGKE